MTVPGVGIVVALTYRTGIDAPERFSRSRDVGAHFGLTPRRYSSGQIDYNGHAAATAGFSIQEGEIPRETDCLLEEEGFEPSVPGREGARSLLGKVSYRFDLMNVALRYRSERHYCRADRRCAERWQDRCRPANDVHSELKRWLAGDHTSNNSHR
jgi:hypothetical protein